jgi:magnesium-transporting ATPase (P-type)
MRVIALSLRLVGDQELLNLQPTPDDDKSEEAETDLVFVGLAGIMDPPRPNVREAVLRCHAAGIRVCMITGDHQATAMAIAKNLGIMVRRLRRSHLQLLSLAAVLPLPLSGMHRPRAHGGFARVFCTRRTRAAATARSTATACLRCRRRRWVQRPFLPSDRSRHALRVCRSWLR